MEEQGQILFNVAVGVAGMFGGWILKQHLPLH
jgi:hypothetical protein